MVDHQRNYNIGDDDNVTPIMILLKVKAKLLGRQIEEKEDFMKKDINETYVKDTEGNKTKEEEDKEEEEGGEEGGGEEKEEEEDPIKIPNKDEGDNDDKVEAELPDDDFFDARPNQGGKIQNVGQESKNGGSENPDEVIGDFFNKPMMAQKAQMKIKRKLAKMKK